MAVQPSSFIVILFIALQGLTPGVIILPGCAQQNSISEPPTGQGDLVSVNKSEPAPPLNPALVTYYDFESGEKICPLEHVVLLQPATTPSLGGEFFVQGLDPDLFRVGHLVERCQPVLEDTEIVGCDQIWIKKLATPLLERDFFWVLYQPAGGGTAVYTQVVYGPPDITYRGIVPADGLVLISEDGIAFELRDPDSTVGGRRATVCESVDGVNFQQSRLLQAIGRPALECTEAISGAGGFSRPYTINVSFFDLDTIEELTPRVIAVTFPQQFGNCSSLSDFPTSELINVTGAGGVVLPTSGVVTDVTTEPPAEGTTVSSSLPEDSTATLESTTLTPPLPPASSPGAVWSVLSVLAALMVLVVVVLLGLYVRHKRRKQAAKIKSDVEKRTELELNSSVQSNGHLSPSPPDVTHNRIPAGDQTPAVENKTTALTSDTFNTELHREAPPTPTTPPTDPPPAPSGCVQNVCVSNPLALARVVEGTPRKERGGSGCSESSSEGSEVALIRKMAEVAENIKDLKTSCDQNFNKLNQQNENLLDGVDYIARQNDISNLSNS